MKLLGSTKSKISQDKNCENMAHTEFIDVALAHCNNVKNDYQQDSRVLYTFVLNKSFDQLLDSVSKNVIFSKTFDSELSYNEVWFTNQKSKMLEMEYKIHSTELLIKV